MPNRRVAGTLNNDGTQNFFNKLRVLGTQGVSGTLNIYYVLYNNNELRVLGTWILSVVL